MQRSRFLSSALVILGTLVSAACSDNMVGPQSVGLSLDTEEGDGEAIVHICRVPRCNCYGVGRECDFSDMHSSDRARYCGGLHDRSEYDRCSGG